MKTRYGTILPLLLLGLMASAPSQAKTISLASSGQTDNVYAFDAETEAILGALPASISGGVGDCAIHPNQSFGFVTNTSNNIFVLDLDGSPLLASGTNPIVSPFAVEDVEASADGRWLAACGAGGPNNLGFSLFDLGTRTRITASSIAPACQAVAFCGEDLYVASDDGTGSVLRRLAVDDQGGITVSNAAFLNDEINNLVCGANPGAVVALTTASPLPRLLSLEARAGMQLMVEDIVTLASGGVPRSAVTYFPQDGSDPYVIVRYDTSSTTLDTLRAFQLDAATNDFANNRTIVWQDQVEAPSSYGARGLDQLAISPRSGTLYVGRPTGMRIYDGTDGTPIGQVVPRSNQDTLGVCTAPREIYVRGGFESGTLNEWSGFVSPASGPVD